MKQIALALVLSWLVALAPSITHARSMEAMCENSGPDKKDRAEACLTLLGQDGLSITEQLKLHRLRADLLEGLYDHGIALIEVNHILRIAPDDLPALMQKARLLDELGGHDKALAMIKSAEDANPDSFLPLQEEFSLLIRADDTGAAMDLAEATIARFPQSPEGYVMRAGIGIKLMNLRHAMDDYHVAFLYGDHSATTIKGFLTACQWSKGPCPYLYPKARVEEPNLTCEQARDWTLAVMRERLDRPRSKMESMVVSARQMKQFEDDWEAAIVDGSSRAGVFAVASYVGATIALQSDPSLGKAVRLIVGERMLRCFYDNDATAKRIIGNATSHSRFTNDEIAFDDIFHQNVRENELDYAYQILNATKE